jgi:MinD superfamily P-loop ATPase
MKKLVILSGKGGVGKSSITASLAVALSSKLHIVCADCDVDASNLSLVLGVKKQKEWKPISTNQKAMIDNNKCTGCGKCIQACYFNALALQNGFAAVKDFSCEGCGVCQMVCPFGAIEMKTVYNARIGFADTPYGFEVVSAQLEPGEAGSGKVVAEVKGLAALRNAELMLIDSAAGIGCPVIASVAGSDYAIIVAEPTPPGISDMKRAAKVVNHFRIPFSIVINKCDLNESIAEDIERFAKSNKAEILCKIPYMQVFSQALVSLTPVALLDKGLQKQFARMSDHVANYFH